MSEEHSHGKIHLVRNDAVAIDGEAVKASQFRGKQKIRSRAVNKVCKHSSVASQDGAEVVLVKGESPHVTSKGVIFREDAIDLQFGSKLKFKLTPSASDI